MQTSMIRVNKIINNETYIKLLKTINENEKDRRFCKHDLSHSMDVARIAWIINLEENLQIDKEIIYAAALLHDLGRAKSSSDELPHHVISMKYSDGILRDADFSEQERSLILEAISMHSCDGENAEGLPFILYKADKLSRMCFNCGAYDDCYWKDENKNKGVVY